MSSVWSIRRSTADKKLAGVCGGVARHWNVDPILVRVGWVLLALSGGVGIVLYAAAWLLVPADHATTSVMDDLTRGQTRGWPREAWVAIVVIACLVTFAVFRSTTSIGFGPAVVLALIWYFGYYKTRVKSAIPPAPSPTVPSPHPASSGSASQGSTSVGSASPVEPYRSPGPATPFTEAAEAWRQRVEDIRRGSSVGPGPGAGSRSSTPPPALSPAWSPASAAISPAASPAVSPAAASSVSGFGFAPGAGTSTWQTYPSGSGPSAVQDPPGRPEALEAAARADFLAAPDPVGLYTPYAPTRAAAAPSRRTQARSLSARRLRLTSVIALGLVLLGLAIADSLGAPITPVIYAAAALSVVGLTLVAATWLGRARGILPIGLLLAAVVLGLAVAEPASRFVHQVGYTSVGQLPVQPMRVDRGLLRVDLSRLDVTSDATFRADVGTGAVEIVSPPDTNLVLDYSVGNGVVMDNDTTVASGPNLLGTAPLGRSVDGEPTLTLDVDVDSGLVAVKR